MCGRYRLSRQAQEFADHFEAECANIEWEGRYKIAPAQQVPVIRQDNHASGRNISLLKWGLVPSWAKDPAIGIGMINARSETAAPKPAFEEPLPRRRCLIPADGFYEWAHTKTGKQPYCFEVRNGKLFAFAGLWEQWREPHGNLLETCTILTTRANDIMADVHDRMPVIVAPESYNIWLDPGMRDVRRLREILRPYDAREMRRFGVSTRLNNVRNDDPSVQVRLRSQNQTKRAFSRAPFRYSSHSVQPFCIDGLPLPVSRVPLSARTSMKEIADLSCLTLECLDYSLVQFWPNRNVLDVKLAHETDHVLLDEQFDLMQRALLFRKLAAETRAAS
jgi:putative SOS response-associated peptidase YedK